MKDLSKLERFDATLNELETELDKLQNTSEAYVRLQALVNSYQEITKQLEENSKGLEELVFQHVKKHQEIETALSSFLEANNQHHEDLKEINTQAEKRQSDQIEQLRRENKAFYLDFERTLKIKLEENKAEIKRLIEEERQKVKEIFEAELDKRTQLLLNGQKQIKNRVLILGLIILSVAIAIAVKLFLF